MTVIQFRRRLIVVLLLAFAIAGALVRQFSDRGTTLRDIGTLLMLLWLPIIGNIIAWGVGKVRRPAAAAPVPASFEAGSAFVPQLRIELTLRAPQLPSQAVPLAGGEYRCALVTDNEGFSARWFVAPGDAIPRGTPRALEVEFLKPESALPRFPRDAAFRVLVGESFIADGRVLEVLAPAT